MAITVSSQIRYIPLPPEKEYAYKVALVGLYEMLIEALEEIDELERKEKGERET